MSKKEMTEHSDSGVEEGEAPDGEERMMRAAAVEDEQRALLERIERTTHWLKRKMNYRGSKHTEDFRDIAAEKLLRSEAYGQRFREEPESLMPVVPKMMRNLILEYRRRAGRQRRFPQDRRVEYEDHVAFVSADAERFATEQRRGERLERELERFAAGESSKRVRPANRAPMVTAFRRKLQGATDLEIARELDISKATANGWIQFMTTHLARVLAEGE